MVEVLSMIDVVLITMLDIEITRTILMLLLSILAIGIIGIIYKNVKRVAK